MSLIDLSDGKSSMPAGAAAAVNAAAASRNYVVKPRLGAPPSRAPAHAERASHRRQQGVPQALHNSWGIRFFDVAGVVLADSASPFCADYRTVKAVQGPLVILDKVKVSASDSPMDSDKRQSATICGAPKAAGCGCDSFCAESTGARWAHPHVILFHGWHRLDLWAASNPVAHGYWALLVEHECACREACCEG